MHPINIRVLFRACLLSVSGCMNFSPMSDPSRFFMLNPLPQSEQSRPIQIKVNSLFLGIGPIRFPAYLDRDQIVTRAGQNRFDVSENDRWAEPWKKILPGFIAESRHAPRRSQDHPISLANRPTPYVSDRDGSASV